MLDSTVVEGWLPWLSSERASNEEVLPVSSAPGAERGQEAECDDIHSLSPRPCSLWLGLFPRHWGSSVGSSRGALIAWCRLVFSESCPSRAPVAVAQCWLPCALEGAAGFTALLSRPGPRLQQPQRPGGGGHLPCLPASPLWSQRYHWHRGLCQSVCAATTAHCLCLSL